MGSASIIQKECILKWDCLKCLFMSKYLRKTRIKLKAYYLDYICVENNLLVSQVSTCRKILTRMYLYLTDIYIYPAVGIQTN